MSVPICLPVAEQRRSQCLPLFVGVFLDQSMAHMNDVAEAVGLDLLQLHGNEGCAIAASLVRPAIRVLPVIPQQTTVDEVVLACGQVTDVCAVLLDTKLGAHASGGTGTTFDWRIASQAAERFPVMVAGGLTPDNVHLAVASIRPLGVDVASGVELADGSLEKDVDKVRLFVRRAREAAAGAST